MRYQGRISDWNDAKGFGFVTPNGGGDRAFVHIKAFSNPRSRPVDADLITYEVAFDGRNRRQAVDIRFPGEIASAPLHHRSQSSKKPGVWVAIAGLPILAIMLLDSRVPLVVPFVYAGASLITFMAYAFDKAAASKRGQRTPERILHLLSLAGGWPGAFVAQSMFRHKTVKSSFQVEYVVTIVVNLSLLGWLIHQNALQFSA